MLAIRNNPVEFLILCHRVMQENGNIGGYMLITFRF
ncbi:MAG: hypothetical protein DSZ28_07875 [Thiothrix sp.]|nr:MAG: hypothetical protein DSZ28_07875 [Thiothrix sp.]